MSVFAAERDRMLAALEAGLSEILAPHGFQRQADSLSSGETFRRWERRLSWRIDRMEMVSHEADSSGPEIQLSVNIPLLDGGSAPWEDIIDGLRLTGHFLMRDLLTDRAAPLLDARQRLVDRLRRAAGVA